MTVRVVVAENPMDPRGWEAADVDDAREHLLRRFPTWPATARVYDLEGIGDVDRVAGPALASLLASREVTPSGIDPEGARLAASPGPLLVAVAPADPITAIVAVVAVVVAVGASLLLMPKLPKVSDVYQSPNNRLSTRTNQPRPQQRIPDIFGTVRAVPDLLSVPYRTYEDNQEVETAYMCVGRGAYDVSDVKDGDTPVANIAGTSAVFYGPGTSPNGGDPQFSIGAPIPDPVYSVVSMNDINGQTIRPPNASSRVGEGDVRFTSPDKVETNSARTDFTQFFDAGDHVAISNAGAYNGTYTILAVASKSITLANPAATNPAWSSLSGSTAYMDADLGVTDTRWLGPYVAYLPGLSRITLNLLAQAGLYSVSSKKGQQLGLSVTIEAELTPVNTLGNPVGPSETFQATLTGSATSKDEVGVTLVADPSFRGRTRVRVRRVTPTDMDFDGQVVDEVRLVGGFGLAEVDRTDFGDVTTVHVRTYATSGATSVKERRFNVLVTRRVPERLSDGSFGELAGSNRVDDIVSAICLDPQIGNQPPGRVDFDDVYATVAAVEAYFGSDDAVSFGYTFDDDNTSFEETITAVAQTAFCLPYRQGSLIRLTFERANAQAAMLFNHRNVLPGTQDTQVRFGVTDDHDGVELDWTDPDDGAPLTYRIPADGSALQPRKVEVTGVRSRRLAAWHAWRAWLRLVHQNVSIEQETTQDGALVMPSDRVRITDLTRAPGMEGEVVGMTGLTLELSQPVELDPALGYVAFLQHTNETVESIVVVDSPDEYSVRLGGVPSVPLVYDPDAAAPTRYQIAAEGAGRSREFLVIEREPNSNFTETVRAINYTPMYYDFDALQVWLDLASLDTSDASAWARDGVINGGGSVVVDPSGRASYWAPGAGGSVTFPDALPVNPSYSKAVWVGPGSVGDLLSGGNEQFKVESDRRALVAHAGAFAAAPLGDDWTLVGVSYDGNLLRLYVDGEPVGQTQTGRGTPAELVAFAGASGNFADLRLWNRALDHESFRALYRATRRRYG